jgi:chromatin remodeling complex protein RSC6
MRCPRKRVNFSHQAHLGLHQGAQNLQNPANKRNVLCDEQLKAVMGKDEVTMFEMAKLVGQNLRAV